MLVVAFRFQVVLAAITVGSVFSLAAFAETSLTEQARLACKSHNYKSAITMSSLAVAANATDGCAYLCRANALSALERNQQAHADYELGLRLCPKPTWEDFYGAANCYVHLEDNAKAMTYLNKSLKLKSSFLGWRLKGQLLGRLDRFDEALNCFTKSISMMPNFAWNYDDRASCNRKLHRYDDAIKDLDTFISIRPNDARGYANRSKLYEKLGNFKAAARDKETAITIARRDWD